MQDTPTTAVVVTHEVENYETWKRAFDQHATNRKNAGIVSTRIFAELRPKPVIPASHTRTQRFAT